MTKTALSQEFNNLIMIAEGTTQHSFQGMQWKLGYIVAQEVIKCLNSESFPQLYC